VGFLSIAFLAALPLAAAPILLHLFDRRRNVVIDWGAMQFLMEAATRKTSARKLKQWLLLLLRVLAVAALVLALARPQLPGSWFGSTDRGETIFILDNSMSMMRTVNDQPLFDTAVTQAIEELSSVKAGDSVRILAASPYPVWVTTGSLRIDTESQKLVEDQLQELRPTNGTSDLLSALFTAVQAEVQPTHKRRHIVLLTDGQAADWSTSDDSGWERFRDVLKTAPVPTRLDVVEVGQASKQAGNLAVNSIRSSRTVVGVGQPFTLTAQIQNYGRNPSSACEAVWSIGQEQQHESQVPDLEASAVHDVVWKHSFSRTGVYALSCQVDASDELAPDNQATVVVEVVEQVPVLLVESARDLAEMQQDSFFVQAALGWVDGEPLGEREVHVPEQVHPDQLDRMDLSSQRAVVIPNLTELSPAAMNQLHEFVDNGGGLWIALGPRTDVETFNQYLFADGNGLSPLAIDRIVAEEPAEPNPDEPARRTTIDPFMQNHPATAELSDNEQLDIADVSVSRRFRFVAPPEGEDVSVLLSLTNGEPLAVEKYLGRGRIIVQAIPLRLQWSELARSQAFVVMVHDWLAYLTQPRATRHNLSPGDPITVHLADTEARDATLKTPHGDEIELTADPAGDGVVFRSSRTILPGDYSLEFGLSGDRIPFQVQRDPQESDLAPLTTADNELLAELTGLSTSSSTTALSGTNQNEPLWPTLLMILVGLIAAELLLSGMISRERFGTSSIAETSENPAASAMDLPTAFSSQPSFTQQTTFTTTTSASDQHSHETVGTNS
jgi:hypothetical protein